MSALITTSLVGSISWLNRCPPTWKEKAYTSLKETLARIYGPPNESMKRGLAFERMVQQVVETNSLDRISKASIGFQDICSECIGGEFQKTVKTFIDLDGVDYCLYGRLDVLFPDIIKDIKTTGKYKGEESYLNSFQHKMYCYVTKISRFRYLVAEFEGDDLRVHKVHKVDYKCDPRKIEDEVIKVVSATIEFLKQSPELWELYNNKFSRH